MSIALAKSVSPSLLKHVMLQQPYMGVLKSGYGTRHMNEISTRFFLVLLQKQATKCSTPEVYPILSSNTSENTPWGLSSGSGQLPEDFGCK